MKYAEIHNNEIVKIHNTLPAAWKNISGFNTLSTLELSNLEWSGNTGYKFYPVTEESYPTQDARFYEIVGLNYSVDNANLRVNGTYTVTPRGTEVVWDEIRKQRNYKLYLCDWTQLPDAPLTTQQKADWTTYRQALRDITAQEDPFNITWPTEPAT